MQFLELGLSLVGKLVGVISNAVTSKQSEEEALTAMTAALADFAGELEAMQKQIAANNLAADDAAKAK